MFHRNSEAAERMKRRQAAEDSAPRLSDSIPSLQTLRLNLRYRRGDIRADEATHLKIVVVPRAPSLFLIACADKECRDGGHDVTRMMMDGLHQKRATITGEDPCNGTLGSAQSPCTCVLIFEANATYG